MRRHGTIRRAGALALFLLAASLLVLLDGSERTWGSAQDNTLSSESHSAPPLVYSGAEHGSYAHRDGGNTVTNLVRNPPQHGSSEGKERQAGGGTPTPSPDPDLEPGFPVRTFHGAGTFRAGPALHTLVGNIDDDPTLEIVVTGLANGPLYAWNYDGSLQPGWPTPYYSAAYPVMANLTNSSPGFEVFAGYYAVEPDLVAFSGLGTLLPGWPRTSGNFISTPPSAADVDGDGLDELFIGEEDRALHAYRGNGAILPGWPVRDATRGGQERHTPAIADLDENGDLEILTASGGVSGIIYLFAYHHDGSPVAGFPVQFTNSHGGYADTYLAVGDVDGDNALEIVLGFMDSTNPVIKVVSNTGVVERTIPAIGGALPSSLPVLADLDGDGVPEIILQTGMAINVWRGDGRQFPGWPVEWIPGQRSEMAPAVGDVDGDGEPDIVTVIGTWNNSTTGEVLVYNRYGQLHPRFPKILDIGHGYVPAVADVDLDGRNEMVITGKFWNGFEGQRDKVWMFDLHGPQPCGRIESGQFGNGPQHQGVYRVPTPRVCTPVPTPTSTNTPTPTITRTSLPTNTPAPSSTSAPPSITPTTNPPTTTPPLPSATSVNTTASPSPNSTIQAHTATSTSTGTPAPPTATQIVCTLSFGDVQHGSTFYEFVRCLACRGIISGYADGTFRPNNEVTRGQLTKIVSNAAGFNELPGAQIYEDVPPGSTFYEWIDRLSRRGYMSGHVCGGPGEPCTTGRPYFRPSASATRGQTSKIVSNAAGYSEVPTEQTFEDVPPTHTFYREIQRLASRNIMGGYPCGGSGEPCVTGRPYFRPQNNVTRGQSAKIVANTFYFGCEAHMVANVSA